MKCFHFNLLIFFTDIFGAKDWLSKIFDFEHGTYAETEFFLQQFLNLFIPILGFPKRLLKVYFSNFSLREIATLIQLQFSYTIIDHRKHMLPKILWTEDHIEDILNYGFRHVQLVFSFIYDERSEFDLTERECFKILHYFITQNTLLQNEALSILLNSIPNQEFVHSYFTDLLQGKFFFYW